MSPTSTTKVVTVVSLPVTPTSATANTLSPNENEGFVNGAFLGSSVDIRPKLDELKQNGIRSKEEQPEKTKTLNDYNNNDSSTRNSNDDIMLKKSSDSLDSHSMYDINQNKIVAKCPEMEYPSEKKNYNNNNNNGHIPHHNNYSKDTDPEKDPKKDPNLEKSVDGIYEVESTGTVFRQMAIPFLIAGIGSVFAGILLNRVQTWEVFTQIPQFEIMVSAFLGLIGNIETTLASRLSTHANLGRLDSWSSMRTIIFGNVCVVQCQASTVGLFAALLATVVSTLKESTRRKITADSMLLLCCSSMISSIISNTLLATLISIIIIVARKFRINPDNISTPVAASMGDVCTIGILALISQGLYDLNNNYFEIGLIVVFLLMAPAFGYFARKNRYTQSVIITGWSAIIGAVVVEQPGGIVMQSAFEKYSVMSTFQPLVNGIASNLVGIQTSRISTFLHSIVPKGRLPESNPRYCVGPFWVFFSKDLHASMARLLLLVLVPAHLFFMSLIYLLQNIFDFNIHITLPFIASYTVAVIIQLCILLYLAYVSVLWAWKRRINPDNSAIPFTSALADVFGNCLMAVVFLFLASIHDPNAATDEDIPINSTMTTLLTNLTSTVLTTLNNGTTTISPL